MLVDRVKPLVMEYLNLILAFPVSDVFIWNVVFKRVDFQNEQNLYNFDLAKLNTEIMNIKNVNDIKITEPFINKEVIIYLIFKIYILNNSLS